MKLFFLTLSAICGALTIWTGSPWFLMPQYAGIVSAAIVAGVEVYEHLTATE